MAINRRGNSGRQPQRDDEGGVNWLVVIMVILASLWLLRYAMVMFWKMIPILFVLLGVYYAYTKIKGSSGRGTIDQHATQRISIENAERARQERTPRATKRKKPKASRASSADTDALSDFDRRMRELDEIEVELDDEVYRR